MAYYVYNFNGPDNSGYNELGVNVLAVWLQMNRNVTPFVFTACEGDDDGNVIVTTIVADR